MSLTLSPIDKDIQNKNPKTQQKKKQDLSSPIGTSIFFAQKNQDHKKTKLFSFSFFLVFKSNKSKSKPIMFDFLKRENTT